MKVAEKGLLGPSNKVRKLNGGGQLFIFLHVIYSTARLPSLPQDYEFLFAVV
jgi:hypothetical protein